TFSWTHSFTQRVTGTVSQTVSSFQTFLQRVSAGHGWVQRTRRPGLEQVLQVQGSKVHSPGSQCQLVLFRPGTQYCSTSQWPHFLATVFISQTCRLTTRVTSR